MSENKKKPESPGGAKKKAPSSSKAKTKQAKKRPAAKKKAPAAKKKAVAKKKTAAPAATKKKVAKKKVATSAKKVSVVPTSAARKPNGSSRVAAIIPATDDAVRLEAYWIYLDRRRRGIPGTPVGDWCAAERLFDR